MTGINGPKGQFPPSPLDVPGSHGHGRGGMDGGPRRGGMDGGPGRSGLPDPGNSGVVGPGQGPGRVVDAPPAETQTPVHDNYGADLPADPSALLTGEGAPLTRPVTDLVPDLRRVQALPDLRERFTSDFSLIKNQLTDLPHLDDTDKATRAFEFFSAYAERFVVLAKGDSQGTKQGANDGQDTGGLDPADPDLMPDGVGDELADPAELEAAADGALEAETDGDEVGDHLPSGAKDGKKTSGSEKGRSRLEMLAAEFDDVAPSSRDRAPASTAKGNAGRESALWGEMAMQDPEHELNQVPSRTYTRAELAEELTGYSQTLKEMAFDQLHDARTGKNGVETALALLQSQTPQEVQDRAAQAQLLPRHDAEWPPRPPAQEDDRSRARERETRQVPEQLLRQDARPAPRRDLGESPNTDPRRADPGQTDGMVLRSGTMAESPRLTLPLAPGRDADAGALEGEESPFAKKLADQKLGRNMLWNALHTFRGRGEDSTFEKDKLDKLTWGAILLLVFFMGVVMVLVMI